MVVERQLVPLFDQKTIMARAYKLNDLQLILLSAAAQRADGSLLPRPDRVGDPGGRVRKAILPLIKQALVAKVISGLSRGLELRRDVLGRPVENEGGLGPDMVTPIWITSAKDDPTIRALLSAGVTFNPPSRKVRGIELPPRQYGRYAELTGQIAKPQLDALVGAREWRSMSAEDRDDEVSRIMRRARADARGVVMQPDALAPARRPTPNALDPWTGFAIAN